MAGHVPAIHARSQAWIPGSPGMRMVTPLQPLPLHADIHLALDIAPFLGGAQRADQFLERIRMAGAYSNQVRKSKGSPRSRQ